MAGTSKGVKKGWLKRKKVVTPRPETSHVLQSGKNIASVAVKYNVPIRDVLKANGINSVDQIKSGLVLKIPAI